MAINLNPVTQFQALFKLPYAEQKAQAAEEQAQLADITAANLKKPPLGAKKTTTPKSLQSAFGGGSNFGAASAILQQGLKQAQAILAGVPKIKAFNYDKALADATAKATTQANKFYTEKLSNFMEGVNIERTQSKETETRLLNTLNAQSDRFLGSEKQKFEVAKESALQGFAATSSVSLPGFLQREFGREESQFNRGISDFLSGQEERRGGFAEQGRQFLQRSIFGEKIGRADIAREKKLDIQTGIAGGITTALQKQQVKDQAQAQAFQQALAKANIVNQSSLSKAFGVL